MEETDPADDPVASITVGILSSGLLTMDIDLEDYSDETLTKFALLFASLSDAKIQYQGLETTKDAFARDGKGTEFETFLARTLAQSNKIMQAMLDEHKEAEGTKGPDDPLILPTDLM